MYCLYQEVYLLLTFGTQFQVIHKQQVMQFEYLVASFVASLSSSEQPYQRDHTQNKQQWRQAISLKNCLQISNSPNFFSDELISNFHDFMLLFRKSCTLFAIRNICKHWLIQVFGTTS